MNIVNPSIASNSESTTTSSSPALNQTFTVLEIPEIVSEPSSLTTTAFPSSALNAAVQPTLPETACHPLQDVGNSPVIKVLHEFLDQEEIPTTARSRRVTKSRLITSEKFIQELEKKEKQKK